MQFATLAYTVLVFLACCSSASEVAHDVIVVGAGLTGSVVISRLAELRPSATILVIEAGLGSPQVLPGENLPPGFWQGQEYKQWDFRPSQLSLTEYDVPGAYPVMPCWDRSCPQAWSQVPGFQCKVLGGCGTMNGALMQRPAPQYFSSWPEGWQWPDFETHFQTITQRFSITQTPSADGRHYLDETGSDFMRNVLEAYNFTSTAPLSPTHGTMGAPLVSARAGERQSTASVLLPKAIARSNVELVLGAEVTEIVLERQRAVGVRVVLRDGTSKVSRLSDDGILVLAGGALNSPRLLLQSGIGPADALPPHTTMKVMNERVGRGVSDHSITWMTYQLPSNSGVKAFRYDPPSQAALKQYAATRSGGLAQYGPTLAAFFADKGKRNDEGTFDVELFVNPASLDNQIKVYFVLMRPVCSSGNLRVVDTHGRVEISDNKVHLGCEADRATMRRAVQFVNDAMRKADSYPVSHDSLWMQGESVAVMNHWASSCSLGPSAAEAASHGVQAGCADARTLRVHGTENVAVVDSSLLPSQVWGHPAKTLTAMALKASELLATSLLHDRRLNVASANATIMHVDEQPSTMLL